ncbi:Shedu anti-phage system protein SduA domain-containing protein [Candidatus Poriferisocius sp.]|uniref:Shedu anti-phage system protein SduA domain-containing protein n=1 Tax=Candidatus Poriferisocius sp. TaxID=3101276 RepID=UPI003B5BCBD2
MSMNINRRSSRTGDVQYSDPVELHDTNKLRIEFVPFFIERTGTDQMSCKIVRYDKTAGWNQTSISLAEPALHKLHDALRNHLAVADAGSGRFVIIPSDESINLDCELSIEQVARALEELVRTQGIVEHFCSMDLGAELIHALRTGLRVRELRDAVAELTNHLREGTSNEAVYQNWCKRHSWSFGNSYVVNDQIRSISATDQIDLLLPRHLGGFRDLIELKRPDLQILVWDASHQNWHWSADVSKAIGQCHRYLDVLHAEVGLSGLRDAPEVVAYHPRATIVIGRSVDWQDVQHQALHGLNRRLADISVMSYDHLLSQARRTLELVEAPEPEIEVSVPVVPSRDLEDDFF